MVVVVVVILDRVVVRRMHLVGGGGEQEKALWQWYKAMQPCVCGSACVLRVSTRSLH